MSPLSRRTLMASLAGSGLALGLASPARAFSQLPGGDSAHLRSLHETACGATASHKELVDEVNHMLGERYDAAVKKTVVANLTCPICGCPLAGLF